MPAAFVPSVSQAKINPRFLPFIDRVLITGLRLGDTGKREAINKVLKLVPEWRRGDCWRRLRQLRRISLTPGRPTQSVSPDMERVQEVERASRRAARAWTAEEDAKLLDWAGYEPVSKIAQRLGRTVRAVRFRLGALGMSAKVSDGWSQRSLAKLLHISAAKLRRLVGTRMLRVRDPRITTKSLLEFCSSQNCSLGQAGVERINAACLKQEGYSWDRVRDLLGLSAEQVQALVSRGKLKVLDPFVSDRSFEEFCTKHGDQINPSLIEPATVKWLKTEYGIPDPAPSPITSRAQKHALVLRRCKCGRLIAGNVFFKHVRRCETAETKTMQAAA